MQPITAMDTPGRWPVASWMVWVTSCRSNRVRPQLGQDTYSVLVLRMREPCSRPKLCSRSWFVPTWGASTSTPSPRPSTSSAPAPMPLPMMSSSLDTSPKARWWITGTLFCVRCSCSNTRRAACSRETSPGTFSSAIAGGSASAFSTPNAASSSTPVTATAQRAAPSGSATGPWAASSRLTTATALGTGAAASAAAGATTPTPASCSRRSVVRAAASSAAGTSARYSESEVAMSLKGMPTAVLHPRSRYSWSGCCSCATVTAVSTDPSRCSR
mmetsp:Transcript_24898/g.34438  ORF Transcript_24898/g.34438 Transcript_24898/m.34438 type:complete len:272 (-) Transcript_24898:1250-2065(-)